LLGDSALAVQNLLHEREDNILDLFTDAAVTNTTTIAAAADEWDNYTSVDSDPAADVETVAELILADSNVTQDMLSATCSARCFRTLQDHPKVKANFTGAITTEGLTTDQVAHVLKIKEINVSSAGVLSAADARGNVHPNAFNLYYKNEAVVGNGLQAVPTFARWIFLRDIQVAGQEFDEIRDLDRRRISMFGLAVIQNAGMAGRVIDPLGTP
jgi:hypothetical protein